MQGGLVDWENKPQQREHSFRAHKQLNRRKLGWLGEENKTEQGETGSETAEQQELGWLGEENKTEQGEHKLRV